MGASQSHVKTPERVVEPTLGGQAKPTSGGHEDNDARVPDGREDDGYAGLKAIRKVCNEQYASQGNHLVAAAPIKSW